MTDFKKTLAKLLSTYRDVQTMFFKDDVYLCPYDISEIEDDFDEDCDDIEFFKKLQEQAITYKLIDSHGGEGMGDEYWTVYEFHKNDETLNVQFYGTYTSYYGTEFDDFLFVVPAEKTITVWAKAP